MEQKDKELLLKDLCARLPYGVKIQYDIYGIHDLTVDKLNAYIKGDKNIKPYLRPMSSMTDEEKDYVVKHSLGYTANIGGGKKDEKLYFHFKAESYDWLNKKMFDFRGLVPKDLALSTDVFNPYKD